MENKYRISAVFPAFNEEENIERLYQQATSALKRITDDYEIVIVNDGSRDKTREIADRLAREDPHLSVYHHPTNLGYAKALNTGFTRAKMPLIFYSDADLQFDLNEIDLLLPLMEEADIGIGYRIDRKDSRLRLFFAWGYNRLARFVFGIKVRDIDCAFKMFKKEVFDKIKIESDHFMVDTEILAKAKRLGLKIKEIGVTHLPRAGGKSTVRPAHIYYTLRGVLKLKWQFIKEDLKIK